jgi:hypothetical protein
MRGSLNDARQAVVEAFDRVPYLSVWAFEYTPASPEAAGDAYLRHVREADIVIWLAGAEVTQPVINEIDEALAHNRQIIVIRFGTEPRSVECEALLKRVKDRVKYGDAASIDELAQALELAMHDVIARALRGEPSLSRVALIEGLGRASRGRCVSRWQAAGLPRGEALSLADNPGVGAGADAVLPDVSNRVILLSGEMGSGKSLVAERHLQRGLENLITDGSAPVPVWMSSKEAQKGLAVTAQAICDGVGEPRVQGAVIVVDGLDEVGADIGAVLLDEARQLVVAWPETTVLITSRPMLSFNNVEELRRMPELEDDEVLWGVANIGAGRALQGGLRYGLPKPVLESMRRPLFALLYGVWQRQRPTGQPRSQGDLLAFLGKQAEKKVASSHARETLIRLSTASIKRGLGAVPAAEVGTPTEVRQLIDSGVVGERPGGIVPALPILAQWFAAQALLEGQITATELLSARDEIDLWLYPLALAVATGSFEQASTLLGPLMQEIPGFAFAVIDEALARASLEGIPAPPWREAGMQMRNALQSIADSAGELSQLVLPVRKDGHILPLAIGTGGEHIDYSFWYGDEPRDDIFQLTPTDLSPFSTGFRRWTGTAVGRGAAWAWRWGRDELRGDLTKHMKSRTFNLPGCEPWITERVWVSALTLAGGNSLLTAQLEIAPLRRRLDGIIARVAAAGGSTAYFGNPQSQFNALWLKNQLDFLTDRGDQTLTCPLPRADLEPTGGMIGLFFSDQRLIELATAIYENALVIYCALIEQWFETLRDRLPMAVTLPAKFEGRIDPSRDRMSPAFGIPHIEGHFEPMPQAAHNSVEFVISTERRNHGEVRDLYSRILQMRPHAARWISAWTGGSPFELNDPEASSKLAYSWLWRDLQSLHLVDGMAPR